MPIDPHTMQDFYKRISMYRFSPSSKLNQININIPDTSPWCLEQRLWLKVVCNCEVWIQQLSPIWEGGTFLVARWIHAPPKGQHLPRCCSSMVFVPGRTVQLPRTIFRSFSSTGFQYKVKFIIFNTSFISPTKKPNKYFNYRKKQG